MEKVPYALRSDSKNKKNDNRFTEELFAVLIAFIFIFNAFNNIAQIGTSAKFRPTLLGQGCKCEWNRTEVIESNEAKITKGRCQFQLMLRITIEKKRLRLYLSTIPTYNSHFNSHLN